MGQGELWYLDQRKPHRAANMGDQPRVHLVGDFYATEELRGQLVQGYSPEGAWA
jgi:hypothetical protein